MLACTVDDRISLRPLEREHAEQIDALEPGDLSFAQGEWGEWVRDGAAQWLAKAAADSRNGTRLEMGIFDGERLVGVIALHDIDRRRGSAALDYALDSRWRNRGITTRCCRALAGHAFSALGLQRLEIRVDTANLPSLRVAEKAGFRREGVLRSYYRAASGLRDCVLYSMQRDRWEASGPS